MIETDTPQVATYTAHALCMLDIDRHSECIKRIPFLLQPWFRERASVLRHTYIARLVFQSCDIFEHTVSL
jgi:hypothetical protein